MVLLQAFTAGVMVFGLGTGMAAAFFEMTLQKIATRGIILMWQSVAITGGCILFVVIIASLLSIRRVIVLEAAAVFRVNSARKRIHRYFLPRGAKALRRSHACPSLARWKLRSPPRGPNAHCS